LLGLATLARIDLLATAPWLFAYYCYLTYRNRFAGWCWQAMIVAVLSFIAIELTWLIYSYHYTGLLFRSVVAAYII